MKREVLCAEEKGFGVGLSLDPRKVVSLGADDCGCVFKTGTWVVSGQDMLVCLSYAIHMAHVIYTYL